MIKGKKLLYLYVYIRVLGKLFSLACPTFGDRSQLNFPRFGEVKTFDGRTYSVALIRLSTKNYTTA